MKYLKKTKKTKPHKRPQNTFPNFSYETPLWDKGYTVIGLDEVGRGALAGPVYVGAACIGRGEDLCRDSKRVKKIEKWGIQDSKKISSLKREELATKMRVEGVCTAISASSVQLINRVGIVKATQIAAKNAVSKLIIQLELQKPYLLSDAFRIPDIDLLGPTSQDAIIAGDSKSITIAAASIFAKIERDAYMCRLAEKFPNYFWNENKGYGTKKHQDAILSSNICDHHRQMFVRNLISRLQTNHFEAK